MKEMSVEKRTIILLFFISFLPVLLFSQILKQEIVAALEAGDTTLAVDLLEKEIKLNPTYEYNYYALGQIYAKRGNLGEAEKQFQLSYDKNGKFFEGLYALGITQLRLGKLDLAEKNFSQGIKKAKDQKALFYNGMGLLYMARGDYNAADRELRQAIILDSTDAEYHINLGDANFMMKVYPLALAEYEKALTLDTASLDVYFHMAEACLELKDYNCALEKLKMVLRRDSTHAEAWMKAGGIYYKAARSTRDPEEAKQRFNEAIGSYKKFMELHGSKPDSVTGRAYYEAAMAYLMRGGYEEAKEYFKAVLSIPVEPKDIYYYYARAFQGNKEFDSALVYYQKHIDWKALQGENANSSIGDDELYRWKGEAHEILKDYAGAVTAYLRALAVDSMQERALYGIAVSYNYLGDYRNALIYYMKRIALGVDERNWPIYYNAATSALYLAEVSSQEGERKPNPGDSSATATVDPLAGIDFAKLAADYLEKVLQFKPDNYKAANMLASTYLYQLSNCPRATELYEKVLAAEPDNCDALKSLGYANFAGLCSKNYSRALDYLNKALNCITAKAGGQCSDPSLILWIAQTYHFRAVEKREAKRKEESKADFKAAFDWYNKTVKCDPGNKAALEGIDQVKFEF
jgi:tetratricopeptide (TPR) repeat protein